MSASGGSQIRVPCLGSGWEGKLVVKFHHFLWVVRLSHFLMQSLKPALCGSDLQSEAMRDEDKTSFEKWFFFFIVVKTEKNGSHQMSILTVLANMLRKCKDFFFNAWFVYFFESELGICSHKSNLQEKCYLEKCTLSICSAQIYKCKASPRAAEV